MQSRADVRHGMWVFSADGIELGRVDRCGESEFTVEKGRLLRDDLRVPYEDVARVAVGQIVLTRTRHDYVEVSDGEPIVTEDELAEVARGELSPKQAEEIRRKAS
jgi:hypothetical protein